MNRRRCVRAGMEMLVLYALLLAIDHRFLAGHAFAGVEPNPYWLPVLMMALAYGSGIGLASAAIASAIWIAAPHNQVGSGDQLQYLLRLSLLPMLWTVVALIVGEVTSVRLSTIEDQGRCSQEVDRKQERIADTLANLASINRALQIRIATENLTVGEAIAVAVDLVEPEPANQVRAIERLIALAAQTEDFTFFDVRGRRGVARFRGRAASHRSADLSRTILARTMRAGAVALPDGTASSRKMLAGLGVAALPVRNHDSGGLIGLLVIHSLPPSLLTESKMAELSHVAESLCRISARFLGEVIPLLPARWNAAEERVA